MDPVQNDKGEWVIPASRRPDGTWRKEKPLKEGYVPPDEIRAFETRASRQPKKVGIPGMPPPVDKPKPKLVEPKKKVEPKAAVPAVVEQVLILSQLSISDSKLEEAAEKDPKKRLKALKKKLRDIADLGSKDIKTLSIEQIDKLSKKEGIEAEILSLAEFDK